ncbi:hypothetical protein FHW89_003517 [Mucilaginibacter sp. SG564]|nr:hypothetical protein [Mucilaginibacter sp. SG564]
MNKNKIAKFKVIVNYYLVRKWFDLQWMFIWVSAGISEAGIMCNNGCIVKSKTSYKLINEI